MTAQIYTPQDPDMLPGVTWINDAQLRETAFPETQYLILGMLPCGYTVVIGAPKTGKTALALPIAQRLTLAGYRVLYLVLDDTLGRMKTRSIMALPATDPTYSPMTGLWYLNGWQPKSKDQAFTQLRSWLERWRENGKPFDLVIVDTYGRFAGRKPPGVDIFSYDYSIGTEFKALHADYGASTMLNHHTRKHNSDDVDWLDMVSGSAGMTAAADAIWYIERTRGTRSGILRITGNDMEEMERAVLLGPDMVWRGDNTVTPGQARHSGVMRAVLDYMMGESQTTAKSLAEEIGASQNNVHQCLQRLAAEGLVAFGNRVWELTGHSDNRIITEELMVIPPKASVQQQAPEIRSAQPGGSVGGASGPLGVGADVRPVEPVAGAPAVLPPQPAPEAPTVPSQRQPHHDAEPGEPWCDDAVAPVPYGEGAIGMMIETLKKRRLVTAFRLAPEVKSLIPDYDSMMLGWRPNQWQLFPHRKPEGRVVVFDRRAAFFSSKCWLALQTLTRTGPMDFEQVLKEKRSGIFEIAPAMWPHPNLPSPYGMRRPPQRLKVTRSFVNRLFRLAELQMMDPPQIISTLSGRGSENILTEWQNWCLAQRRECAHDPDLAAIRKADQNKAIGSLRVTTEGKKPGPVDRPDWQYEIHTVHGMMMHYFGMECMLKGDPLIAIGNTDELVFLLPEGEDPETWVPAGLAPAVETSKFSRKRIGWAPGDAPRQPSVMWRDAGEWFDCGGLRGDRPA
jgi:hypothetical protein